MLDYLGVPFSQQGRTVGENRELLDKFRGVKPDEYEKAYQIVVNHMAPSGEGAKNATNCTYHDLVKMASDVLGDQEFRVISDLKVDFKNMSKELSAELMEYAKTSIDAATKRFETIRVEVGNNKPITIDGPVPECFKSLLDLAAERVNILQVGPAGCGKTHNSYLVAHAMGLDFASQSCSAGVSESSFAGWLLPTGDNGKFSHVESEFIRIYEKGGVFLFDEIDAADPNVLIFINQALSNGTFYLPQRFGNVKVKKHKDFVAIAAANTFGSGADSMYHARNALDASTLDRFKIGTVVVDYSSIVENALINPVVLEWGIKTRAIINKHRMRKIMSTRILLDATKMVDNKSWDMKKVRDVYYSDWSADERKLIERDSTWT